MIEAMINPGVDMYGSERLAAQLRSMRLIEVLAFTFRTSNTILLDTVKAGANPGYTVGIYDETGHLDPGIVSISQIQHEANRDNGALRVFVQTDQIARQTIGEGRAAELGLKLSPRQLTLKPDNYRSAIVSVTDPRLSGHEIQ